MATILLGSTGEVGRQVLRASIQSSLTPIICPVRQGKALHVSDDKFKSTSIDFDSIPQAGLDSHSAANVIITLGTTRAKAGSAANFERIDRHYVLESAKAAKTASAERVIYCSSAGSSSSSPFLYPKSKGLTEEGLAELGYTETIIFRPGYLQIDGGRPESRILEKAFGPFCHYVLARFSSGVEINTKLLGNAMIKAAEMGADKLVKDGYATKQALKNGKKLTIVNNEQATRLGST
ncbi:uncharacterized protein L969DRAFT_104928 [Mixia osmundae IAM 14324]|uniref:NAD(P)-binding domain-containing protein n=1 Tax=Mixia osmundae (strain CBS 9802 / IAM 14324 / JCM 22182 / KY 12970) TaxID=764103 RepID=G7E4Q0_MIXOS|nr:uncharacterized protein L969DRAFT_104928 [Mixia osmundae IAM 14324]KEI37672.1 hypothetical protein L969DRAFT_104928 [Mixia osmundae IAM 14324]GAA97810.1 hypothetical protein E5Q_04489 [Mixia osmundae IAM 14324]